MTTQYGLIAIGNAIVDILAQTTEEFITSQAAFGMNRGAMSLIDEKRAAELYNLMGPTTEMSGGSAGNTMAAYASFGGKGAYIGKVANDQFGKVFAHDTRAIGVHFDTPPLMDGPATAQCLILVTPDAQRTMNTFLGASTRLKSEDINEDLIANSQITYLEGYLFDDDQAKAAFIKAAELVKKHGRKLSLTLSDPFCVVRHRDDFLKLVENYVDILFANEEEIKELTQISDADEAHRSIAQHCDISIVTKGKDGSSVIRGTETAHIQAITPEQLVDTTGAGDAYAAGFLFGLTENKPLTECGRLGSLAASEAISHMGPRPITPLKSMI
ncbi:MAG: adenosine kinase [Alphaproteobacteria bacterium]|jgi:sugar/nucleoside kinase (ribokinase family)|nr:adenosine kinase [Alphaproteobacteria bacterium]MCB1550501.1 adenosine kinase [Alphaproteobacteria bacterium]MCB9985140.1 adenosine kinase [Micavibrio sp.]HRK98037.1 adenosine kinase [Alphaproteobacteria bacterium]